MSVENREVSIVRVLAHEGGYTNDAADPGGPTNWGITIHDARMYWKKDATSADVRAMPKSVAIEIYRKKYWAVLNCDALPAGVDYCIFDYGVNSGVGRARKVLNKYAGGSKTPAELINDICDERMRFLRSLRTWKYFGKGWSRRVTDVRAAALAMTRTTSVPTVAPRSEAERRSRAEVTPAVAANTGVIAATGAAIPASVGVTATNDNHGMILAVVLGGIAIAAVLLVLGSRALASYKQLTPA